MRKILFSLMLSALIGSNSWAELTVGNVPVTKTGSTTPTLQNSPIYVSGSNVGIWTASPATKLDVNGNILVEGYNYLYFTSGNNAIYSSDGNSLSLYTNGANCLTLTTDVYTNAWADYSASSTIGGFSNFTTKSIYTKKIGKTVYFSANLSGTSNATYITFTFPWAIATGSQGIGGVFSSYDNSSVLTTVGNYRISGSTVTVYPTLGTSGTWTAINGKVVIFDGTYQAQ